jgi:hypothetical protein
LAFDGTLKPFMVKRQFAQESDNGSLVILFLVARGKTEKEKNGLHPVTSNLLQHNHFVDTNDRTTAFFTLKKQL